MHNTVAWPVSTIPDVNDVVHLLGCKVQWTLLLFVLGIEQRSHLEHALNRSQHALATSVVQWDGAVIIRHVQQLSEHLPHAHTAINR